VPRWVTALLGAAAAALIVFHVLLLGGDVLRGRVLDPVVAARWLAAVALFGALVAFRQVGVPLLWGRRAAVVWLMVLFLHGHAAANGQPGALLASEEPGAPVILVLAPLLVAGLAAAALGVLRRLRRRLVESLPPGSPGAPPAASRAHAGVGFLLAPRAPPAV
jgi:hypothetical protein